MHLPQPFLAHLDDRALLGRVRAVAASPAALGLSFGVLGLVMPHAIEHIVVGAVGGLLSTAMWKLLTYPAFLLIGFAFLTVRWSLGRPVRWLAAVLAGATFDALAAGLGVFIGVLAPMTIELGWRGMAGGLFLVAFTVTGMGVMWLPVRMVYGLTVPAFLERRFGPALFGAVFVVGGLIAFWTERWPEVDAPPSAVIASPAPSPPG